MKATFNTLMISLNEGSPSIHLHVDVDSKGPYVTMREESNDIVMHPGLKVYLNDLSLIAYIALNAANGQDPTPWKEPS